MHILLTGAAGRVGRLVRPRLAELGWTVRPFDLAPPPPGEEDSWIRGDITDPEALEAAMAGAAAVVHLAGIPHEAPFADLLHTNIDGTHQVFEAARRARVPRVLLARRAGPYLSTTAAAARASRSSSSSGDPPVGASAAHTVTCRPSARENARVRHENP